MDAAPAKKAVAKKSTKAKAAPPAHPAYKAMITAAIKNLKERNGSSRQAILKYILANYKVHNDASKVASRLRLALKRSVEAGTLKNTKGSGAAGSFRVAEKAGADKPKKVVKKTKKAGSPKKPKAAKKTKSASPKKVKAAPKKTKATKPKSPKKPKAAKPKAAKPKAAKPKAAKPKVAKKPAAKKSPKPKKAAPKKK